jgi:hypothetical protein
MTAVIDGARAAVVDRFRDALALMRSGVVVPPRQRAAHVGPLVTTPGRSSLSTLEKVENS